MLLTPPRYRVRYANWYTDYDDKDVAIAKASMLVQAIRADIAAGEEWPSHDYFPHVLDMHDGTAGSRPVVWGDRHNLGGAP